MGPHKPTNITFGGTILYGFPTWFPMVYPG